jgi:hypothetical protein
MRCDVSDVHQGKLFTKQTQKSMMEKEMKSVSISTKSDKNGPYTNAMHESTTFK